MAIVATTAMTAMPQVAFASDYKGHWAQEVIESWKDKGIIDGYEDGSFKPKNQVTRAELAKMLVEVFGLTSTEGAAKFKDVQTDKWYAKYIPLVSAAGLMIGTEGEFRPNEPATREEAAYALATAYHVTGNTDKVYKDQGSISAWAAEAVEALVASGYITGYPDDTFKPHGHLTRAEMVVLLDRMTADIINKGGVHTKDIEGNLVVNAKGVTLKDMTINGNLYLAEGIGEGNITLDGVTVTGDVIVEGGGINSIHIKGKSKIKNIKVSKAGEHPVRLAIGGTAVITGNVILESPAVIEGTAAKLDKLILKGGKVEIKGSISIKEIVVEAPTTLVMNGSNIIIDKVTIQPTAAQTVLSGNAQIKELNVAANEVKYASTLTVDKIVLTPGVEAPTVTRPAGGGGGGGGGSVTTPSFKLGNATIHIKDQEPMKVNLNTSSITIDATNSQYITIGEKQFTPDMIITGAEGEVDIPSVNLSLVPGSEDDITLNAGQLYKPTDLVKEVKAKRAYVQKIIGQFTAAQGETTNSSKPISYEQGQKLITWMDEAITLLETGAKDEEVSVENIQEYIGKMKTKINQHGGVDRINKEFGEILKFLSPDTNYPTSITEENGNIIVKFYIQVNQKDYTTKTIQVTLKF